MGNWLILETVLDWCLCTVGRYLPIVKWVNYRYPHNNYCTGNVENSISVTVPYLPINNNNPIIRLNGFVPIFFAAISEWGIAIYRYQYPWYPAVGYRCPPMKLCSDFGSKKYGIDCMSTNCLPWAQPVACIRPRRDHPHHMSSSGNLQLFYLGSWLYDSLKIFCICIIYPSWLGVKSYSQR